jgi:hypothetical protein
MHTPHHRPCRVAGLLERVEVLRLDGNQIGDVGAAALAHVCRHHSGSDGGSCGDCSGYKGGEGNNAASDLVDDRAPLVELSLADNLISDRGFSAFTALVRLAPGGRGTPLRVPKVLRLWGNRHSEHGLDALIAALRSRGAPAMRTLNLI